jgi:hypothetical protein
MTMIVLPASGVVPANTLPSFLAEPAEQSVLKMLRLKLGSLNKASFPSRRRGHSSPLLKQGAFWPWNK